MAKLEIYMKVSIIQYGLAVPKLEPVVHTIRILHDIDQRQITKAEENFQKLQQRARKERRGKRKDEEDDDYGYGEYTFSVICK